MQDETEKAVYLHRNALLREIRRAFISMNDRRFTAYLDSLEVPENFDEYDPQQCEACMRIGDVEKMHSTEDGWFCKACVESWQSAPSLNDKLNSCAKTIRDVRER